MISNTNTAKQISNLMLDISMRLEESILKVEQTCPTREFEEYRHSIAHILGRVLLEVLNPLYMQHPSLKPPDFE
jgi:hypothetical protein